MTFRPRFNRFKHRSIDNELANLVDDQSSKRPRNGIAPPFAAVSLHVFVCNDSPSSGSMKVFERDRPRPLPHSQAVKRPRESPTFASETERKPSGRRSCRHTGPKPIRNGERTTYIFNKPIAKHARPGRMMANRGNGCECLWAEKDPRVIGMYDLVVGNLKLPSTFKKYINLEQQFDTF